MTNAQTYFAPQLKGAGAPPASNTTQRQHHIIVCHRQIILCRRRVVEVITKTVCERIGTRFSVLILEKKEALNDFFKIEY